MGSDNKKPNPPQKKNLLLGKVGTGNEQKGKIISLTSRKGERRSEAKKIMLPAMT